MVGHALGEFFLAIKDGTQAILDQHREFVLAVRPQDDLDVRIEGAGGFDHLPCGQRIGCGDNEHCGVVDVGLHQHFRICRIATYCGNAAQSQRFDLLSALLGNDERDFLFSQRLGQTAPHSPVADQHHLFLQVLLFGRHRQGGKGIASLFQRACQRRVGQCPAPQRVDRREHQRIKGDGEQRPGQNQAHPFCADQPKRLAEPGEDEGKLTDLRQAGRHGQGRVQRITESEHDKEGRQRLAEHDDGDDAQNLTRLVEQHRRLKEHADRDEEQHGKGIAQGQGFLRRAVAEFRLAHHHAGEKCAQGKRNAE